MKINNENLYLPLMIIVIIVTVAISTAVVNYQESNNRVEMAKTGLEECPIKPGSMSIQTMWVKDCDAYLKTYNENTKEK